MAAGDLIRKDAWTLAVACSDPATPTKGAPVRFGYFTGVALTAEGDGGNSATQTSVDFGPNVWDLSVKAVDGSGNAAVAVGDPIFYVDADTPKLSKKASGYLFGHALETITSGETDVIKVLKSPVIGSGAYGSGGVDSTQLATGSVVASKLSATLGKGFIPLDINTVRLIGSNVIQNTSEGGLLDGNTAPILQRVNSATDKALRIVWAASVSAEVQFAPVPKPPDLDGAAALTVHLMLAKDTNTDNTVTVDVQVFDGVGDTECGAATAALAAATLAEYSASVSAGDLGDHPGFLNISLVPGTHTTDAIYLYAAWIEYTRA